MGGGGHTGESGTTVDLIVDGEVVDFATSDFSGILNWTSWDVSEYVGGKRRSGSRREHQRQLGPYLRRPHRVRRRGFHADPAQPDSGESDRRRRAGRHRKRKLQRGPRLEGLGRLAVRRQEAQIEILDYNTGAWGHKPRRDHLRRQRLSDLGVPGRLDRLRGRSLRHDFLAQPAGGRRADRDQLDEQLDLRRLDSHRRLPRLDDDPARLFALRDRRRGPADPDAGRTARGTAPRACLGGGRDRR